MNKRKQIFILQFLFSISCIQRIGNPVDPITPSGFFLQNNLCPLFKICRPKFDSAPAPGNLGIISSSNIAKTSVILSWTAANDESTSQIAIKYGVYFSKKNNITVLNDTRANGTLIDTFTENISAKTVSGLDPGTDYYFNIIAQDSSGNQSVYGSKNIYTLNDRIVLFRYLFLVTGNVGGRIGADGLCSSTRSYFFIDPNNITCAGIRAFLSFSGDNISDMPLNYRIDTSNPIVSVRNTVIANNWNDLTKNTSILNSISNSSVSSSPYWTFTATKDGVVDETNNCLNGTDGTMDSTGAVGDALATNIFWLNRAAQTCNNLRSLLCVCF